jgi:hypothetical protein
VVSSHLQGSRQACLVGSLPWRLLLLLTGRRVRGAACGYSGPLGIQADMWQVGWRWVNE